MPIRLPQLRTIREHDNPDYWADLGKIRNKTRIPHDGYLLSRTESHLTFAYIDVAGLTGVFNKLQSGECFFQCPGVLSVSKFNNKLALCFLETHAFLFKSLQGIAERGNVTCKHYIAEKYD